MHRVIYLIVLCIGLNAFAVDVVSKKGNVKEVPPDKFTDVVPADELFDDTNERMIQVRREEQILRDNEFRRLDNLKQLEELKKKERK